MDSFACILSSAASDAFIVFYDPVFLGSKWFCTIPLQILVGLLLLCVFLDIVLKVVPLVVLCSAGCLLVLIGSIHSEHAWEQKDFIIKN